ncbi:von Willebrand factor D and EGF domain-containing protein-like isoform X2 [Dreissena polymorpha]|uniref:von Willebrand factor D and EGF domain-containing protein-like isoform X2 n=1 Tax=Dreissena polymorpha TaxID=45954 RepID=UPI002264EB88|nr:von Willebrand factor D and EGF domain-containing protein-like isoform X2 [Dreissena polymorpha]
MCHTQFGTSFPRLTIPCMGARSNGTVVSHDNAGNNYLFSFPSGTQVKIEKSGGGLNVYITTPEDDMQATGGICGYFDGNPDNDLKHSDNTFSIMPKNGRVVDDNFVNSWRIKPAGSSIFDTNFFTVDPSLDHDMYYCKCDRKPNGTLADCTVHGNVAQPNVQVLLPGATHQNPAQTCRNPAAHTRTANTILPDDYPSDYVFDYGFSYVPILRADFPSEHGKSRRDAETACNSAIDQNPILQQCVLRAGLDFVSEKGNCVEDFKYFDNGEFVRGNMLSAITKCVFYVLNNESFYDANGNLPAFITSDLCPAYDCNTHGTCSFGRCICDAGYVGDACEIQSSMPPALYGIVKTTWQTGSALCDVTERMCETSYVHGYNVFDNPRLSCKVEVLNFDGHGFVPSGNQFFTAAIYRSMYEVGCKLPLKSTIGGQTIVAFNISITNDASTYSNAVLYVRTDTRCARCIKTGKSCSVKSGTCLIEGNCWIAGETNPSNDHQLCDPSTNSVQWTNAETKVSHTTPAIAEIGGTNLSRFDIWTFC